MLTQTKIRKSSEEDYPPMSAVKIKAFLEEFSWIEKLLGEKKLWGIYRAYVSGVDTSFLYYSPAWRNNEFFLTSEEIFFLDETGKIVTIEVTETKKRHVFFGPLIPIKKIIDKITCNSPDRFSSVRKMAQEFGEKGDSVRYMLSYYSVTGTIIVYRLKKDQTLKKLVEQELQDERKKIQKELQSIEETGENLQVAGLES